MWNTIFDSCLTKSVTRRAQIISQTARRQKKNCQPLGKRLKGFTRFGSRSSTSSSPSSSSSAECRNRVAKSSSFCCSWCDKDRFRAISFPELTTLETLLDDLTPEPNFIKHFYKATDSKKLDHFTKVIKQYKMLQLFGTLQIKMLVKLPPGGALLLLYCFFKSATCDVTNENWN